MTLTANTTPIMQLADVYAEKADAWTRGELNPQAVDQHRAALVAGLETLASSLDFYKRRVELLQQWQSEMRDPERTIACDIIANGQTLPPEIAGDRYAIAPLTPDMFWNYDDAEQQHGGIGEFLNHEICNGDVEVGSVFKILQGKRLPSVTIKVTAIDEEESEAEWEVVAAVQATGGQQ